MLISASFEFFLADLIRRSVLPVPDRKRPRIRDGADPTFVGSVPTGWFGLVLDLFWVWILIELGI